MHLSSRVSIIRFIKFPRAVWIKQADKSDIYGEKNLILLFLSRRTGRAGRKGTAYTFVTSEQGR